MEAQGDKMGAVTLRHEIDGLLASAKGSSRFFAVLSPTCTLLPLTLFVDVFNTVLLD